MTSPADLIRQYIDTVNNRDEFLDFCIAVDEQYPFRRPLTESTAPGILMEGPLADKIKATAKQVASKYGEMKYDMLAKATMKAMDMFTTKNKNPQAVAALQKIGKVGKMAVQNRALIMILAGMTATLIGMASNPAGASQAAAHIDQTLDGDLNDIIDKLSQSGINVGDESNAAGLPQLPPELTGVAQRAAKTLHAIAKFEYTEGMNIESSREMTTNASIEGSVQKFNQSFEEHIVIRTPDRKLILSEFHVKMTTDENGTVLSEQHGGIKDRLFELVSKAHKFSSREEAQVFSDYVSGASGHTPVKMGEAAGAAQSGVVGIIDAKAGALGALLASTLRDKPDGTYKVSVGPQGVQIK